MKPEVAPGISARLDGFVTTQRMRIEYVGSCTARVDRILRLFHEIGHEFRIGARSLREVAKRFADRKKKREFPADLGSSLTTIQRISHEVEAFFGFEYFMLGREAELFTRVRRFDGVQFEGLTELGWDALQLTSDWVLFVRKSG